MWDWLSSIGSHSKPKAKQLQELVDRLLGGAPDDGGDDPAFEVSEKELKRLCSATRDALLKVPSLVEITTDCNAVVVGDLHGQFSDLVRIFKRLGRPGSDGKVWVFLGDYIDRGPMGLEIVATLFALKLLHPSSIHLLRGNHECSEITVLFGFCGECQRRSTLAVWESVMQVFDALPLAAVLNRQVFLCHGGISPYLQRPQDINSIARPLDVNPSSEGLLADLLWADPCASISGWVPNPRGVSFLFGVDVAREWLRAQGLRAIVRAHMVQQAGYEVLGDNEVMTVFSAADYRDSGNTGAVLVIAPSLDFEFVTFQPLRRLSSASADGMQEAFEQHDQFSSSSRPALQQEPHLAVPGTAVLVPVLAAGSPPQLHGTAAGAAGGTGAAADAEPPAAKALQEEVEEEQVVIHQVSSDKDLAELVRKGSQGIQELEQMTGGSRVPAVVLARKSSGLSAAAAAGAAGTGGA